MVMGHWGCCGRASQHRDGHIAQALLPHRPRLFILPRHRLRQSRGAGVDSPEAEDVKQSRAAIIQQLPHGFPDELQIRVGEEGDPLHGVDAVDVRQDAQERDVPGGRVDHVGEGDG